MVDWFGVCYYHAMQYKEDLRRLFTARIRRLREEIGTKETTTDLRLMHTSGTTNKPLPVVYTKRPDWNPVFLGEGERVVMLFGSKPLRLDFAQAYFDTDTPSADVLFLGPSMNVDVVAETFSLFKPTTLVSPPTTLLRMTKACQKEELEQVSHIVLAGELLSEETAAALDVRFPRASVLNTYAATEVGEMGVSCPKCARNEFHPFSGVTFDINNPDEAGVGDVLVSKDNPGGITLEQYNIGDVGALGEHDGEQTIRLLGRRGYDYIKLAGTLLVREEFDRVARELERYILDYKAEVATSEVSGAPVHSITLFVTTAMSVTENFEKTVAEEFSKRMFVTPNSTLKDAIREGVFSPLTVTVVDRIEHTTIKPQRLYVVK